MVAYTLTNTTVTVVVDFTPKVIPSSHPNFARIREMVADPKTTEQQIAPLLDIPATIVNFTGNQVTVQNGKLYFKGYEVQTSLARKIMEFINAGDDGLAQPLIAFLNNVEENPDPRARADLFDWIQASGLPLTGDGMLLAWKAVRSDYRSIHDSNNPAWDHHVGNFVTMPREQCDANPSNTCSRGLHFCSADYLKSYASGGHRVVVVKIHPRDVVAFPRDYGNAKGRACGYQVVGEVPFDQVKTFYPQGSPVYRGFDAASTKPTLSSVPVQTGRRYRLRNGKTVTVDSIPNQIARLSNGDSVWRAHGRVNQHHESPGDVVTDLGPAVERNGQFAVGQTWKTRNGQTVKIVGINDAQGRPTFPIRADNGANFTVGGRYYQDRTSPADLVTLIRDVG